ncbi:hypothetical protein TcasGA2_TC005526 [Tribolium castaneum]|uniref:Uncharacterized protein n=1 Tax=Tribolium castaneum TaxID=7070 RepID=D6WXR4_TRICA|nr:PREDICTED: uncharacterized protein LOC103314028 [Tribolium castaneum]EFA07945.1 hypothetical protein TcasGA2_TC005526 [Tribolium castaneum]|eukprot:XP_008196972.1 PREDICTED: uncharacterized protein LOC103314028 [Tribolium castaneum]
MAQAIFVHVNCPGNDNDMADAAARHAAAVDLFTRQCPLAASVEEVVGIRGRGRKKCRWRVRYTRNMNAGYLQMDGEQLVLDIMNNKPNNTEIVEKTRSVYPPFIELIYSCGCRCNVSPTSSMPIKRCDSVVNLKVEENLVNLKLEEDLQE